MAALQVTLPTWTPVPGRIVHFIVCGRCHHIDPELLTPAEARALNGALLYGTFSLTDGRGGVSNRCSQFGGSSRGPDKTRGHCNGQLTVQSA